MKTTENYGLNKPENTDMYDIEKFNENADILDKKIKELEDAEAALKTTSDNHTANKDNPHGVTKKQIGLENVPNVNTNNQTPTYSVASTLASLVSGEKLSVAFGKIAKSIADLISHIANTSNPHNVTKSQVGLGNVPNVTTNGQTPTYTVASANAALSSGETLSVAFGKIAKAISSLISHLANKSNPHGVTASQLGLAEALQLKYIWYANYDAVASVSSPLVKLGTISDYKDFGNMFVVMHASSVTGSIIIPGTEGTVTPSTVVGKYELYNNGDLLAYGGSYAGTEMWKRIPMHEAKVNLDGLMSAWDKTQVNKIPSMEGNINSLIGKNSLPVYLYDADGVAGNWMVNWCRDDGWYIGGIRQGCGGHPPVLSDNHTSWVLLVLNGMNTGDGNRNHRLQIAFDLVNSKIYMRRGWISSNEFVDWTDVSGVTRNTSITVEGLKSIDAVELNASVEGTLANQIAQCAVVPEFTYICNTENVTLAAPAYWDLTKFAVYQEEFTYDSYYRRHTLIEMTISRATAAAGSQLLFSVNGITYDTILNTPLLISVVDANGDAQQAYGALGTRWGDFDINFVNEPTTDLNMYLRIEFTQYEEI